MASATNAGTIVLPTPLPPGISVPGGAGYTPATPYTPVPEVGQTVITVGAGMQYATIAAAIAAAPAGALILVAPGTYVNDFADITKPLTIAGAGGMVNMVATEDIPNEKGFFITDASCQIDNFTFQGAHIADDLGGNAAGIRYQGGDLVLNNDAFVDNQEGILGAGVDGLPQNDVTINDCTFDGNGDATGPNSGYTHNLYITNGVDRLSVTGSVFEEANVGHELKSRAATNIITGSIFYDGPTGTASYSIDLPDGGADTVAGNLFEKGPQSQNSAVIHFGGEGLPYENSSLLVTDNSFINDLGPNIVGVLNQTIDTVSITGNQFDNFPSGSFAQGAYSFTGNTDQTGAAIANNSSDSFAPGTNVLDFSGDSLPHTVTLTTETGVRGGGGLLNVTADVWVVTVIGGSGGLNYLEMPGWGGSLIVTEAGASDTINAAAGVGDTINAQGNDLVSLGGGNNDIQIGGNAFITDGAGGNLYTITGTAAILGGNGSDTVQLASASATVSVTGALTYLQTTLQGGLCSFDVTQGDTVNQATLSGGSAALRLWAGTDMITTAGGAGGTVLSFGSGTVQLASLGADTIHAGSAALTMQVSGDAQIYAGTGQLAVYGDGENGVATVYGAGGTVSVNGAGGGIIYDGGAAANTVDAALANMTLNGGTGHLNVVGNMSQVVNGGAGGLVYVTQSGGDVFTTAAGAHDSISFAAACSVTSNGFDTISAGSGNSTILASGAALITGSTGVSRYTLNGHDTLAAYGESGITVGAASQDSVTAYGSLTEVTVSGGTLSFREAANRDIEAVTLSGGAATLLCAGSATLTAINLGAHGDTAVLGSGHFNVDVRAAGTSVSAGNGTDSVGVWDGGGMVRGGAGTLTVAMNDWVDTLVTTIDGAAGGVTQTAGYGNLLFVGKGGSAKLQGTAGSETVLAATGNITLAGGGAGTDFTAGSGTAVVTLTPGGGVITFGSGHSSVTEAAWGAAVVYDFVAGHGGGTDVITGFRVGTDALNFQGVSVATQTVFGGSTQLTLSDGTHVTLVGVETVAGGFVARH